MAELVPKYLDNDAIAVIEGDGAVSQELIAQGFDHLLFTGGTEIGRKVYEGAASHLTPVTLELGGKSPVIVAADADIDVAAKRIAWTKLINSGQICIAPDYVLADAKIRDELVDKIKAAVTTFESEDPSGKRIVNQRHFDRLTASLAATKGDVVIGGGSDASTMRIQPTVVVDPDPAEPLMTDEIFGPILPIMTVQSLDDAIGFVNSRPKPLAAYLFTKTKSIRERVIKEVPAGGMVINHLLFHFATHKLPFGGVGPSGIGAYHGKFGFEEFSHKQVRDDQVNPTRRRRLHLSPVYREGLEAREKAVLERNLMPGVQDRVIVVTGRRRRTRARVRADPRQGGRQRRRQRSRRCPGRHRRGFGDGRRGGQGDQGRRRPCRGEL